MERRRYLETLGGLDRAVERYEIWQGTLIQFCASLPIPYRKVQVSNDPPGLDVLATGLAEELFLDPVPR